MVVPPLVPPLVPLKRGSTGGGALRPFLVFQQELTARTDSDVVFVALHDQSMEKSWFWVHESTEGVVW